MVNAICGAAESAGVVTAVGVEPSTGTLKKVNTVAPEFIVPEIKAPVTPVHPYRYGADMVA
jgi:hypothetical protein